MKKTIIVGIILFSFMIQSAVVLAYVYDDFSGSTLDLTKWNESTNYFGFTDEHYVNTSEGVYHIKQNTEGDRGTFLEPKRQFVAGESFSYEVNYRGGSGNHFSQPMFNGIYPPTQIETCSAPGGCGPIGYWNGVPDLGAQVGTYKIKYEFFSDRVKMTAIRPDNVTVVNTFTGISEPYNILINTHTGHNGLMHFDYDNAEINTGKEVIVYHFDEGSGNITYDSSGHVNNGIINEAEWVSGISGSALRFWKSSTYVEMTRFPDGLEGNKEFTVSLWTKINTFPTTSQQYGWLLNFGYGDDVTYDQAFHILIDNDPGFSPYGTVRANFWKRVVPTNNTFDTGVWYNWVFVYDKTKVKMYNNGEFLEDIGLGGASPNLNPIGSLNMIGTSPNGPYEIGGPTYFDGIVDEFAIYNYARTTEEIQNDYEKYAPPSPECNCTELKERVSNLEEEVEDLKDRVETLEDNQGSVPTHTHPISDITGLQIALNNINSMIRTIVCNLLPSGLLKAAKFDTSYCS